MPVFEYRALDKSGKEIKGVREADNEKSLRQLLKREGIFLTSVGKGKQSGQSALSVEIDIAQYFERINNTDLALFTRQLATLLRAGIPLVDALAATVDQSEKPKLRKILGKVRQDVREGMSLAMALGQHSQYFTDIYTNMVRAGEASGTLDQVLVRLAEFLESSVKLKQKVKSAMMYPVLMLCVGGLILVAMFVFVIPQITQIFEDTGQELPILTRMLIAASQIFQNYWWLAAIVIFGLIWGFRRWKKSPKGHRLWDTFMLKVPVFGPLISMVGVSRFTSTLATMLRSGVPLLNALEITKGILDNLILVAIIDDARVTVKEGGSLAEVLKQSGKFPPMVTHMIAVGERSGALEEMLSVVASAYESQAEDKISGLSSLLEPLMIVGMGGCIGIIVGAILVPILQMNSFIQ